MRAEIFASFIYLGIIGSQHTAFACADILIGEKAEAAYIAYTSQAFALVL